MIWDVLILAGGRGSRLGGVDKGALRLGDATLRERLAPSLRGARSIVVVGSEPLAGVPSVLVREKPAFGGPVAAVAAGLDVLAADSPVLALLAIDLPYAAEALPLLLDAWVGAAEQVDGIVAVDSTGWRQPLLAVYGSGRLRAAVADLARDRGGVGGSSMRQLLAPLDLRELPVPDRLAADVDTPADAARLGIVLPPQGEHRHDREGPHR